MITTGYFDYLISNSSTPDEYDDGNSFINNTSTIEDSDESIFLAPRESTSDLSVIIFSNDSDDQLLDTWSELGPDIAGPGLFKDGGKGLYSSPLLVEAVDLAMNSNVTKQQEPISPLSLDTFGLDDVHQVPCIIPDVIVTSVSDEQLPASPDSSCDDSVFSISIQDGLLGIPTPSWSVNPSSDTDSEEQQPEESSSASDTSEEPDELDLTEEEEAILETLCIQVPDIVPTVEELAENPRVPVYVPVFSRHNINSKVVFPVRKPSPPSTELAQRRSSTFSDNVNSMFGQVSASWARTKTEFRRPERTNSIGSMLSSKFAEIRNAHAFNRQTQEPLPRTLERDPYDSWPGIRTAIEAEDESADEDSGDEDSIGTVLKSALEYLKV